MNSAAALPLAMRFKPDELVPTRASLLLRLKDWRDQVSWQQFFDTYWSLIYGVARQAGLSDVEAQEVVQETLIDLARKLPDFHYDPALGRFKGWLFKLTRWRILDQLRRRSRINQHNASDRTDEDESDVALEELVDPASLLLEAAWEAEWQDTILEAAIANVKRRVDPQNYQLFDFYVNKQWPAAKVAATFNVEVDQVYLSKHRCTALIKTEVERLEREGA